MTDRTFDDPSFDPQAFMNSLTFDPALDAEAELPPRAVAAEVMVPRSVRWPMDLDIRVKAAAEARGVTMSQLIRDWVELELTALEHDQMISRADALRALAALRPAGPPPHAA